MTEKEKGLVSQDISFKDGMRVEGLVKAIIPRRAQKVWVMERGERMPSLGVTAQVAQKCI